MATDLARIRTYYDETWLEYRWLWLDPTNYGIHFGYWDDSTHSHPEALNRLNAVLASRVGIIEGDRVLDAGCGVGGSAIWLAKNFDVHVTGITPVRSQVERARRFADQLRVARLVDFVEEDYTRTSFADGSFDVVWAVESVCHAVDKRAFYREAHRVLRPGGRLALVEYMRTTRPFIDLDEELLHSWLSGWMIPDIATAAEHREWAIAAGFRNIDLTDITSHMHRSLRRLHRIAVFLSPEVILRGLRLRSAAQHGNIRGARDQFRALKRGLWRYIMLAAMKH
jgi:cyclopropane fatty-acyl-phospholipid synthase-like methyltransferase